jgi:hypothetical protein
MWFSNAGHLVRIIVGGVASLIVFLDDLPSLVQALPVALVTIVSGLLDHFRWRANWIQFATTAEELKSERLKYTTRGAHPYGAGATDEEALRAFVTRIENAADKEREKWAAGVAQSPGGRTARPGPEGPPPAGS